VAPNGSNVLQRIQNGSHNRPGSLMSVKKALVCGARAVQPTKPKAKVRISQTSGPECRPRPDTLRCNGREPRYCRICSVAKAVRLPPVMAKVEPSAFPPQAVTHKASNNQRMAVSICSVVLYASPAAQSRKYGPSRSTVSDCCYHLRYQDPDHV